MTVYQYGWGGDGWGQCGVGSKNGNGRLTPTLGVTVGATQVAGADETAIFLMSDETVRTCGHSGEYPMIGASSPTGAVVTPSNYPGLTGVSWVSACGVTMHVVKGGKVWGWGGVPHGNVGDGTNDRWNERGPPPNGAPEAERKTWYEHSKSSPVELTVDTEGHAITGIVKTFDGNGNWGMINGAGALWLGGDDRSGQIGDGASGTTADKATPIKITGFPAPVKKVAFGTGSVEEGKAAIYVLLTNGELYGCGFGGARKTGGTNLFLNGNKSVTTFTKVNLPTEVTKGEPTGLGKIVDIATPWQGVIVLNEAGELFSWGLNKSSQLGIAAKEGESQAEVEKIFETPVKILSSIVEVVAVYNGTGALGELLGFGLARDTSGFVHSWGCATKGQTGQGVRTVSQTPQQIKVAPSGLQQVTQLAVMETGGLALATEVIIQNAEGYGPSFIGA